jgi:hypothetical protein
VHRLNSRSVNLRRKPVGLSEFGIWKDAVYDTAVPHMLPMFTLARNLRWRDVAKEKRSPELEPLRKENGTTREGRTSHRHSAWVMSFCIGTWLATMQR